MNLVETLNYCYVEVSLNFENYAKNYFPIQILILRSKGP